jgi:hypothetical protein
MVIRPEVLGQLPGTARIVRFVPPGVVPTPVTAAHVPGSHKLNRRPTRTFQYFAETLTCR